MVEANTARRIDEKVFVQRDRRADGGARRIRVTRTTSDLPPLQRRLHGHLGARHRLLRRRARGAARGRRIAALRSFAGAPRPGPRHSPRRYSRLRRRCVGLASLGGLAGAAARHRGGWRIAFARGRRRSDRRRLAAPPLRDQSGQASSAISHSPQGWRLRAARRSCMATSARSFLMNEAPPARPTRQGRSSRSLRGFPAP